MQSVLNPLKNISLLLQFVISSFKSESIFRRVFKLDVDCREKLDSFGRENYFPSESRDALVVIQIAVGDKITGVEVGRVVEGRREIFPSRLLNSEGRVFCLFNTESLIGRARLGSR